MNARAPVLVVGIGNELFTDEGMGVVAARRIADANIPGVEVLDGSTLGVALLPEIADREAVLILDAIVADTAAPGELIVLRDGDVAQGCALMLSAHQLGIAQVLAAAEFAGRQPSRLAAVGMVPYRLDTGYGLSVPAGRRVGEMVRAALGVLAEWEMVVSGHA